MNKFVRRIHLAKNRKAIAELSDDFIHRKAIYHYSNVIVNNRKALEISREVN